MILHLLHILISLRLYKSFPQSEAFVSFSSENILRIGHSGMLWLIKTRICINPRLNMASMLKKKTNKIHWNDLLSKQRVLVRLDYLDLKQTGTGWNNGKFYYYLQLFYTLIRANVMVNEDVLSLVIILCISNNHQVHSSPPLIIKLVY